MFQFAVSAFFKPVFGRVSHGQQPFRGVGRLRLSFRGCLEPRFGKCSDLRPFFLFLEKKDAVLCGIRASIELLGIYGKNF